MASFAVERFSVQRIVDLTWDDVNGRYRVFFRANESAMIQLRGAYNLLSSEFWTPRPVSGAKTESHDHFLSTEELETAWTKVHSKGVDVGILTTIRLSGDHRRVIAESPNGSQDRGFLADRKYVFWDRAAADLARQRTGLATPPQSRLYKMDWKSGRWETSWTSWALDMLPMLSGEA
jgi:hypothetical protein